MKSRRKLEEEVLLRKITVKSGLKRINIQEEITIEVLLDSKITELVMSLEFAKKKGFKLKKIERPIYIRNINEMFNRKGLIEHTVEVNIYYKGYKKRIEIDVISR